MLPTGLTHVSAPLHSYTCEPTYEKYACGLTHIALVADEINYMPSPPVKELLSDGERQTFAARREIAAGMLEGLAYLRQDREPSNAASLRLAELHGNGPGMHPLQTLAEAMLMPTSEAPADRSGDVRAEFYRCFGYVKALLAYANHGNMGTAGKGLQREYTDFQELCTKLPEPSQLTRASHDALPARLFELYQPDVTDGTDAALKVVAKTRPYHLAKEVAAAQRRFEADARAEAMHAWLALHTVRVRFMPPPRRLNPAVMADRIEIARLNQEEMRLQSARPWRRGGRPVTTRDRVRVSS